MRTLLTDEQLQQKALAVLEEQLGPVEALRFLAMVRREPFDYQAWRETAFAGQSVEELFRAMQQTESAAT